MSVSSSMQSGGQETQYQPTAAARLNAWVFRWLDGVLDRKYRRLKRELLTGMPATVVELGPGCGANFRYLAAGTRVRAIEPNPHMHPPLMAAARRHQIELSLHGLGSDGIDLPDGSVDVVLATLVLCSVPDPAATLTAILRVLRPGGRFICIEHVAARPGSFAARLQRLLFRPWRWFFDGCHTTRRTAETIEAAGFSSVHVRSFDLPTLLLPFRPQIAVVAVK